MASGVDQLAALLDPNIKITGSKPKQFFSSNSEGNFVGSVFENILQKAKENVALTEPAGGPMQFLPPSTPGVATLASSPLPDLMDGCIPIGDAERYIFESNAPAVERAISGPTPQPAPGQVPVIPEAGIEPVALQVEDSLPPLLPDRTVPVSGLQELLPQSERVNEPAVSQFSGNQENLTAPTTQADQSAVLAVAAAKPSESDFTDSGARGNTGAEARVPVFFSTGPVQQQEAGGLPVQSAVSAPPANSIVDQVVQGVRIAQHAEATELHVHLKPEFLGRLSIRVISDIHGVRMEIKAENEMVRQIMQDNLPDLQQRLAEKGIFLDHLALLADSGGSRRRDRETEFQPAGRPISVELERVIEVPEAKMPARLSVLDYFA